jgi:maltooligosyltrehalose trehalohydrolase
MTMRFAQQLSFGATLLDADRTRFRIFAPAQESVSVELADGSVIAMTRQDDGWFEAEGACAAGTRYRYKLATGEAVPDPASRAQADDVHGWSLVVDPQAYGWRNGPWRGRPWHETVIYELHCGLLGGFEGVAAALPRLAELGITAVELMPINDFSGSRNWGYDGVLPFAPNRSYGSPEDLKALVDRAHDLGLMIFLDVVYNHFGPDGNYLALYAPSIFRADIHTPWGESIDFRRGEVRRFFTENALYWLMEYRFDGLRFDAVHAISESDWLDEMAAAVRANFGPDRHIHLILENDDNAASHLNGNFDAQWNDDAHHVLHVLLTGEHEGYYVDYAEAPAKKLARSLSEGFVYQGEPSKHRDGVSRGTPSAGLPPTAFVFFLQNHDQIGNRAFGERLTVLTNPEALEAATALQLLAPHIPLIFMGEEEASQTPFLFFADYTGDLANAVREGRRREFARFAAFADPARREKIPDPIAPETFKASVPQPHPDLQGQRVDLYRRLLALRRDEIMPRLSGARAESAQAVSVAAVIAHWRMGDGTRLTIAVNLGDTPAKMNAAAGEVLFESRADASRALQTGTLPARSTVALLEAAT